MKRRNALSIAIAAVLGARPSPPCQRWRAPRTTTDTTPASTTTASIATAATGTASRTSARSRSSTRAAVS